MKTQTPTILDPNWVSITLDLANGLIDQQWHEQAALRASHGPKDTQCYADNTALIRAWCPTGRTYVTALVACHNGKWSA